MRGFRMKNKSGKLLLDIENAIGQNAYSDALSIIVENAVLLLSSSDIKPIMSLVMKIPDQFFETGLQKLIKGWICFLCGENLILSQVLDDLPESALGTAMESSIFYSLKAITNFARNPADSLKYAKLSVDILEPDPDNFFYANARLTYGHLLSAVGDHRRAINEFFSAYHLFKKCKGYFPAVVSLLNYGLKKHALGEIADIVTLFRNELTACSGSDSRAIFNLLKLPLGIAYFELNRQSRAIKYLESVKTLINSLDFTHMFGVLEMHLVCAYAIVGRYDKAYSLIDELSGRLSCLNYDKINNLCAALRVHINTLEGTPVKAADRELLEADYLMNGANTPAGTLLALARLKLKGEADNFNMNDLIACHKSLETSPNIPFTQTAAILAAEYYYQLRETAICREYLEKAADIFMNCRMSARFLIEKAGCLSMLKEINRDIYRLLDIKTETETVSDLLTQREKEILSLIAQGFSNQQISQQLYIGTGTTKWHINNIFGKLNSKRRSQAVAQAKKLGLL